MKFLTFAFLLFAFQPVISEAAVEMEVLVDRTSADPSPSSGIDRNKEALSSLLQNLRKLDEQLEKQGYLVVDEGTILEGKDEIVNVTNLPTVDQIENLAFQPLVLEGSEFERAELLGVGSVNLGSDGRFHNVYYRFSHPELGLVLLDEYSFQTDPDMVRYAVRKPIGNILINGRLGTLNPMITPDGTVGRTLIHYYTHEKHYELNVYKMITRESSEFAVLERLAQALY
jgi:hypothetical protein